MEWFSSVFTTHYAVFTLVVLEGVEDGHECWCYRLSDWLDVLVADVTAWLPISWQDRPSLSPLSVATLAMILNTAAGSSKYLINFQMIFFWITNIKYIIINLFLWITFWAKYQIGILIFFLCGVTEGYNDDIPLQKWSPEYFQYRFFPTPNNFKRRMPSYIQV